MDEHLKWDIVSSEYLIKDKWLNARKDICRRKDGKIINPYYVIEYMDWVTALCVTEDNKFVLINQYRHALGKVCLELPGGCVDDDDSSLEEAVKREVLEETGYAFKEGIYLGKTSPNPSTNNNYMSMFLLTGGKKIKEQSLDGNEEIEVILLTYEQLLEELAKQRIVQSMHVTTIFYALQHLGTLKLPAQFR